MATSELPVKGQYPELDAETRVPILVGISIAFALASTIVVLLRLYTRTFILRTLGWDDATITFAQVCVSAGGAKQNPGAEFFSLESSHVNGVPFAQVLSIGVSIITILRKSPRKLVSSPNDSPGLDC